MAISGIGLQVTPQHNNRIVGPTDKQLKEELQATNVARSDASQNIKEGNKSARFPVVPIATDTNKPTSSRRDLAELETFRNKFQIQDESANAKGPSANAVQSFIEVAEFQKKDELNELVGIDIFV